MQLTTLPLLLFVLSAAPAENPVFKELQEQGVKTSDGKNYRLPPPMMADGLDAAGQKKAIEKAADAKNTVEDLLRKSYYAPVVVKIKTLRPMTEKGSAVRSVDVWFVAHGDWNVLNSKKFADSTAGVEGDKKSEVVLKAGVLTNDELKKRKLTAKIQKDREERFLYTTFVLFDRVEVGATRLSVLSRGDDSLTAAGRLDPRFDKDAEYPNQWRELLRDAQAEIVRGPAQRFANAGGYAKVTRLKEPADAVFIECHIIYEEPYGWFEGVNLVKQKVPVMVQEKVRTFRRKWAVASEK
jgi:hypothetical protein